MRRIFVLLSATLLMLAMTMVPATAMQPAGEPAQHLFTCVDGSTIPGHPGAVGDDGGIIHAALLEATGEPEDQPTAWNAVKHAGPIESSC